MTQAYATRDPRRAVSCWIILRGASSISILARPHRTRGTRETSQVRLGLAENLERCRHQPDRESFSRVREIDGGLDIGRAGPWLRWTAAGVLEAERGFRKLTGYRAMPALVAALRAHDTNRARSGVDQTGRPLN
jgi:hypothetical protein